MIVEVLNQHLTHLQSECFLSRKQDFLLHLTIVLVLNRFLKSYVKFLGVDVKVNLAFFSLAVI